jgi:transcriptional regulator with PAS, ATPase and Fis domain
VLDDPAVSRRHAVAHLLPGAVLLVDLGSRNGLSLGAQRVEQAWLGAGAVIGVGQSKLRFSPEPDLVPAPPPSRLGAFETRSPRMGALLRQVERAAKSEVTILLEGETGTGKELLARAIHAESPRRDGPWVVVDCGAIAAGLMESQLFGHRKGAFTGAHADRAGAFEAARGGTIFLDEIGELPLALQPKLLRALEARTVVPLGDSAEVPIDVRVVAATHRDLEERVKSGELRADLFYRLAVVRVKVPPLRERPEDIAAIAERYVTRHSEGRARLAPEALAVLGGYPWPGNARELRNLLDRALALGADDGVIRPADLFLSPKQADDPAAAPYHDAKSRVLEEFERRYVTELLERHQGNVAQAARAAGLSRAALYLLMKRIGIAAK